MLIFRSAVASTLALLLSIGFGGAQTQADYWVIRGDGGLDLAPAAIDLAQPATRRYAVVVGNGEYEHAPDLPNAARDAGAVAAFLRDYGFRVEERYDLDKRGFEDLMRRVLFDAGTDSAILFYFAGHGLQIGRRNYLVPTDADLSSAYDAPFETVTLDSLVRVLGARSRLQLVILDSCRDNPFAGARVATELDPGLYEAQAGFNPMFAPVNTLLAYSTSPGAVAFDGGGENSPFTGALLRIAGASADSSMREILGRVRREVYTRTGGRQVPWESSTLVEPFVLRPGAVSTPAAGAVDDDPGPARSLREIAAAAASSAAQSAEAGAEAGATISAPLERRVRIGEALRTALDLSPEGAVRIEPRLSSGRLILGGSEYDGGRVPVRGLDGLVYEHLPRQRSALGPPERLLVTERLKVEPFDGAPAEAVLRLEPDPCDVEAGDWLDPEGVGIARYPNEIAPDRAVGACRDAVARQPDRGRFHYQLGRALQARLDYEEAEAAFSEARELGHTRAWHALGDLIAESETIAGGQADRKAPQEALDHYARGVERGDPYAYHALGKQLLRYGEDESRRRLGFELLSQAVELGHTFSMNELGYYFMQPESEHYQPERGLRYLRESAARNDMFGYNNLGLVYDEGLGDVAADAAQALEWYRKASAEGHPYAPVNIGRMYFAGRLGGGPDLERAIEWYDRGLARGNAWGGANAAWIIANESPRGYSAADAALRAAKAAVLRDPDAAAQAAQVLAALDRRALDTAAQMLVREFAPDQEVDGVVGPMTIARIEALASEHGLPPPASDPVERLRLLAEVFWKASGIRIDLL